MRDRKRGMEIEVPTSVPSLAVRSVSLSVGLPDGVVVVTARLLDEVIVGRGVAADKDGDVSVGRRLD